MANFSKKMRAGSGVSFQYKNNWYKLYYEEEIEVTLPNTTELGKAEQIFDVEREKLWNKVNSQVDNQVLEITQMEER